jgi:hypothetical protein
MLYHHYLALLVSQIAVCDEYMDRWMGWGCLGRTELPRLEMATDSVPTEPKSKHLYQRFFNCQPYCYLIAFDPAVRLLSNHKSSQSSGTYTIGISHEISPQRLGSGNGDPVPLFL